MTDSIADLLTRIRNAQAINKATVSAPYTTILEAVVKTMEAEGYITGYRVEDTKPQKTINITLKYINKLPVITKISRVSKPGRRVYQGFKTYKPVLGGHGIKIISTNQGVMTDKQAKSLKLGGEVLCQIW